MFGHGLLLSHTDVYDEYGSNNLCCLNERGRMLAGVTLKSRTPTNVYFEDFAFIIKNERVDVSFPISNLNSFRESRTIDPDAMFLTTSRVFLYSRAKENVLADRNCTLAVEVLYQNQLVFIPEQYLQKFS